MAPRDQRIEFPSSGATYSDLVYGVYEYSEYPRSSVLAGQPRRVFLDSYPTLAEAQEAYPAADVVALSGYAPPALSYLPGPDDPDPQGDWEPWTNEPHRPLDTGDDK